MNKRIAKSVRKFSEFNFKDPSKAVHKYIDLKTPLIKIGEVPEITYISNKEGKRAAYKHKTSAPRPKLYAHPDGKFFVIIGGRVKVKDWLYN